MNDFVPQTAFEGWVKGKLEALDERINGIIDDFKSHIKSGHSWRVTIFGIAFTLILNIIIFSFVFGQLSKVVERNQEDIKKTIARY